MTSEIKVNKVSDSCGSALVTKCGSNITLGASGKTVRIACGASTEGMGRTGTVDWCSTIYTNSPGTITSVAGKGYFINTTAGEVTINLPTSPSVGDIIAIKDYANTFDSNNVIIGRGGSNINGVATNSRLFTESQSVTLIYVDSTKGWQDIHDSTSNITGATYVVATGGNATLTCGNFKTHVFTADGTLCVSAIGSSAGSNAVEYLVVAGGGSGGKAGDLSAYASGGGGAGGWRSYSISPTASPINASALMPVSVQAYPITVGAGGSGNYSAGSNSVFSTITSAGGGVGGISAPGGPNQCRADGKPGGSGGGGGSGPSINGSGGTGNTPSVTPAQGTNGGTGNPTGATGGGGGGGGLTAGANAPQPVTKGGDGGTGSYVADSFIGPTAPSYGTPGPVSNTRYFSGGGGGGSGYPGYASPGGLAGSGGGGAGGGATPGSPSAQGENGTANTGGGAGGSRGNPTTNANTGGSGIVMIRYRYQ